MACDNGDCGNCNCGEKNAELAIWKSILHKALGSNALTSEEEARVRAQLDMFPKDT